MTLAVCLSRKYEWRICLYGISCTQEADFPHTVYRIHDEEKNLQELSSGKIVRKNL